MKVKMLKTVAGSDRDSKGIALPVRVYKAGEEVEMGEKLANGFIKRECAISLESVAQTEYEAPTVDPAPETKIIKPKRKRGRPKKSENVQ